MVSNILKIYVFEPLQFSFNYISFYILGSLEEAQTKTNMAQFLSDPSTNEDSNPQRQLKSKSKVESPPSLRLSKFDF